MKQYCRKIIWCIKITQRNSFYVINIIHYKDRITLCQPSCSFLGKFTEKFKVPFTSHAVYSQWYFLDTSFTNTFNKFWINLIKECYMICSFFIAITCINKKSTRKLYIINPKISHCATWYRRIFYIIIWKALNTCLAFVLKISPHTLPILIKYLSDNFSSSLQIGPCLV